MITSMKNNSSDYTALFEEASDFLAGYRKVRTFTKYEENKNTEEEKVLVKYYYKNESAEKADNLFIEITDTDGNPIITDMWSFAQELDRLSGNIYIKVHETVDGFNPLNRITTLEEYFAWIEDLAKYDRKYTALPLKKENQYFEINANTRAIAIPADFKKNGVAVQGDDLAEILYFTIDRYYDYMDLNNCEILIQWETPKNSQGEIVKSVSRAFLKDIESKPGKLVFGWALSDNITQASGNLKFSIRFFQWLKDEKASVIAKDQESNEIPSVQNEIAYSFSTLTATVAINPGMNFNLESEEYKTPEDVGNRLISRIRNSSVVGGYQAAEPIFEIDNEFIQGIEYDLQCENPEEVEEEQKYSCVLTAKAYSTDAGTINYTWKKQNLDDNNSTKDQVISIVPSTNIFLPVDDLSSLSSKYAYYTKSGNKADGSPIHTRYTKFDTDENGNISPNADDMKKEDFKLFIKTSQIKIEKNKLEGNDIDVTGEYWAVAENRITNSVNQKESAHAKLLKPNNIEIIKDLNPSLILDPGALYEELVVDVKDANSVIEKKTYTWYRNSNSDINDENPVWEKLTTAPESNCFYVDTPGRYKVQIHNERNLFTKTKENEVICRVTNPPSIPKLNIVEETREWDVASDSDFSQIVFKVKIDNSGIQSDEYRVQWMVEENGQVYTIGNKQNILHSAKEEIELEFRPFEYLESGEIEDVFATYYVEVTNIVNGQESEPKDTSERKFIVL